MTRNIFALAVWLILNALAISPPNFESGVQANSVTVTEAVPIGDACRNVSFKFKNLHHEGGQIKFQRIKYLNKANGNWQTEDVNNVTCNQGASCITTGNNLRDSEGEALIKFRLIYRFKGRGAAANWSDEVESGVFEPNFPTCNANRTYSGGSTGWVIR